jgi:hypothetical protein
MNRRPTRSASRRSRTSPRKRRIVALALGAFWLFKEIERHNEILNCVASGRRNCDALLHPDAPAP